MPVVFMTFLIGAASLSALPLITAGFYSKDEILWYAFSSGTGNTWLWLAGIVGAFVTTLYSFRMVFITFFGEAKTQPSFIPGHLMTVPLIMLAVLSIIGGFLEMPASIGNIQLFSKLIDHTLPVADIKHAVYPEFIIQSISAVVVLTGIFMAYLIYYKRPHDKCIQPQLAS